MKEVGLLKILELILMKQEPTAHPTRQEGLQMRQEAPQRKLELKPAY
jgi:hypothetical protein